MSGTTLIFFIAGVLVFFVFALAVQMRLLAGVALKRAARAKFDTLEDGPARFAVLHAVNGSDTLEPGDEAGDAAKYLTAEYPSALAHIRLARKVSLIMPGVLLVIIVAWRLTTGGEV
ncbi:hypothetical protein [Henriciella litoralis]|uniref:hypothetical protein n=1 Tax=Henriciella litoralis TaxID=568102 RepID=UPI000A05E405|nr:hypothetical protein [Henriciella litoralis]